MIPKKERGAARTVQGSMFDPWVWLVLRLNDLGDARASGATFYPLAEGM